jgi:hypothetical protein
MSEIGVLAIAWLEQSAALLSLVAVDLVAVLAPFLWRDKRASEHYPMPSD